MKNNVKLFILTWVYCGKVTEIMRSFDVKKVQRKRTELKKELQYKKGFFEVRTSEGLKVKPILKQS